MNCAECRQMLSPFEAGELDATAVQLVRSHVAACPACRRLLAALRATDVLLEELPDEPPARSLAVRILGQVDEFAAPSEVPDVMTPEQLARFLQVPLASLEEQIDTIPAFEVGGQLRFRKDRVMEWIGEREREHERGTLYSRLQVV